MVDIFYEPAQALITSPLDFDAALQLSQVDDEKIEGGRLRASDKERRQAGSQAAREGGMKGGCCCEGQEELDRHLPHRTITTGNNNRVEQ